MQTDSNSPDDLASANNEPNPGKFLIPRSQRQRFFIQFTLMTLIGWVVGGVASIALERIILQSSSSISLQPQTWSILVRSLSNVVFAVIFAADQALVVYRYLPGLQWIFATSVGWLIANGVSTAWINYISSIASSLNETLSPEQTFIFGFLSAIAYIISGIWLGLCQWLVLRRYTPGIWWWNFLPSISFLLITILVWLLFIVQNLIPETYRTPILYWSGQGLTAVILGAIPAIGLCTLKRNLHYKTGITG
ncbi:hypothetical protein CDG77_02815 [Nostoc sp. 'Peltigera membranacea cyanobiont' 213]|uniref:hypothetical protein n=1 Tax=unclassified Nostoc TaxID=2593658 RepID=UPI000B958C74|nr:MULTISPECIES: hypothetical protein [unclassified Nostoc]AVH62657.1 hypothetical protein NPM_0798 [Nostoc sp. 'Peltigera membranacea cyanobiont' N6]OYD99097.1 hypothetical protein CDG77_02815 [Nostoc sp. 'Peltigera membranacea cyanobiont' 213]